MKQKTHDNSAPVLQVCCLSPMKQELAESFADKLAVSLIKPDAFFGAKCNRWVLVFDTHDIRLDVHLDKQKMQIKVDFAEGKSAYRRLHGGGRGQAIAKAIGVNKSFLPSVLDCTAGMGEDAFVLASLGCNVTLLERSPLPYILLRDGMDRARTFAAEENDQELMELVERMHLITTDSVEYLQNTDEMFDVAYLDPMFPERKKSAAVKKEMQVFQYFVGSDEDAGTMLEPALTKTIYRVVVKRPLSAPYLNEQEPSYQMKGKSTRFDIYTKKAIPSS